MAVGVLVCEGNFGLWMMERIRRLWIVELFGGFGVYWEGCGSGRYAFVCGWWRCGVVGGSGFENAGAGRSGRGFLGLGL